MARPSLGGPSYCFHVALRQQAWYSGLGFCMKCSARGLAPSGFNRSFNSLCSAHTTSYSSKCGAPRVIPSGLVPAERGNTFHAFPAASEAPNARGAVHGCAVFFCELADAAGLPDQDLHGIERRRGERLSTDQAHLEGPRSGTMQTSRSSIYLARCRTAHDLRRFE